MMLTEKQVKEYQEIYKNEYGHDISESDAREQGTKLVDLMEICLGK